MTQWNFYFSGVLCGKFLEDDTSLMVERLDEKNVQWLPKAPLTEENDAFFKVLCNRSMLSFFQHRKEYENKMSSAPEVFVTENGQRFQARRGKAYFQRDIKFPMGSVSSGRRYFRGSDERSGLHRRFGEERNGAADPSGTVGTGFPRHHRRWR